jgi:hypothetical protein
MAGELKTTFTTGSTVYYHLRNATGSIYNGSTFETYNTANYGNYDIPATEQGTASGFFVGTMPVISAGIYVVTAKQQVGASPAESDPVIGSGEIQWNGTAEAYSAGGTILAATGLDNISPADPGSVATTVAQMIVQTWRRFFAKTTLTATQLLTYANNDSTVRTTQGVSDDGTTQTQGRAT